MTRFRQQETDIGGDLLWEPSEERKASSNLSRYMNWLTSQKGLNFSEYQDLWKWSTTDLGVFWSSIGEFFDFKYHTPYVRPIVGRAIPEIRWFPGATLNYAEHALAREDNHIAIMSKSEDKPIRTVSYYELRRNVASVAAGLRALGVVKGDRVVGYMPNIPETLVAFLAAASIGAIWSSCAPEFGTSSVLDRFRQIEPKVLLATDGYIFHGKRISKLKEISMIQRELSSLEHTVILSNLGDDVKIDDLKDYMSWQDIDTGTDSIEFEPVDFDHPLWLLYTSGTTGLPKPIVQGHGGILLEHFKTLSFHLDLKEEDRFFWFTTTGWMMWNMLVSGLLLGTTVIMYDGSPTYPNSGILWKLAEEMKITYFGTSAAYLQACLKAGMSPGDDLDLSSLRSIGSTASPLSSEGFHWVYENVRNDVHLASFSGGTDMCTGFLGSCPLLPVYAGEIQCIGLGAKVEAYGQDGKSLVGQVGELVLTKPLPSMPVNLWGDKDGSLYEESYFSVYPGIWRHGDWIKITDRNTCIIYGRSDATLNRAGVRMGTSEFYRILERFDELVDSLILQTSRRDGKDLLYLFVVLGEGIEFSDDLKDRIRETLRFELSPRHVPNRMYEIGQVPMTISGKKMEVPIMKILSGESPDNVISYGAMRNPESLQYFIDMSHSQLELE